VNIAFANELSVISDHLDIDVWELIRLANHHPRVDILSPGPGVGGHCIAVDPWFIVAADPEHSSLIRTAREVNDSKPGYVVDQLQKAVVDINHAVIACLGLAFKANIGDVRESPAVEIVRRVATLQPDVEILVAAPHEVQLPQELAAFSNIRLVETDQAIEAAHVVMLLVDHDRFREIEPGSLEGKRIIDTRGFWRQGTISASAL
jgi:UDP-N-acetyl-D-mannosaminuronic acid dehydrogenase